VVQPAGPVIRAPELNSDSLIMGDGAMLPVRHWPPKGAVKAVVIGLHGFNDYSNAFDAPAKYWAASGIATYAYDQRGFGASPSPGIWAGAPSLVGDAVEMARLARRRHPGIPVYFVGVSMGGAVAMLAMVRQDTGNRLVDGAVLVAPAVWGRRHMNAFQRGALWFFSHTVPWFPLTGEGLKIKPSDNIAMLKALGRDPLVLKQSRVDSVHGLVDLMDLAYACALKLTSPTLVLYGGKDEIVPAGPSFEVLKLMARREATRVAVYGGGYHMLLRGLKAEIVLGDIAAWIDDPGLPLPSKADEAWRQTSAHKR
jgi:alpha-beta hydrolase superfamily lysophospholipase